MRHGFIITTHYNNYQLIYKCLICLFKYIPTNSYVILYINESTSLYVNTINKQFNNLNIVKIKNQLNNNGLTGTWNQGIHKCIENNCEVITILGHDTYINKNIKYLLYAAENAQKYKKLEYYGPLFQNNNVNNIFELFQDEKYYKNYKQKHLIGSIFTFPLNSLEKNKLNNKYFFDEVNYPFGYNDIEWYERFNKINGNAIIIENCIINHVPKRSWLVIDKTNETNNSTKPNKSEPIKQEPTKSEPIKQEPTKSEPIKQEPTKSEPIKQEPTKSEPIKQEQEPTKSKPKFNWINYLKKNPDLKYLNLTNNHYAYNHYMTIGKYQNRLFN